MTDYVAEGSKLFGAANDAAHGDLKGVSAVGLALAQGLEASAANAIASVVMGVEGDAAVGASIGSLIPGIGTVVGSVIGAMVGLITNIAGGGGPEVLATDTRKSTAQKWAFPWLGVQVPEQNGSGVGWVRAPACGGAMVSGCSPSDRTARAAGALVDWGRIDWSFMRAGGKQQGITSQAEAYASGYLGGADPAREAYEYFSLWADPTETVAPLATLLTYTSTIDYGIAELAALNASALQALHYAMSVQWLWRAGMQVDGQSPKDEPTIARVIGLISTLLPGYKGGATPLTFAQELYNEAHTTSKFGALATDLTLAQRIKQMQDLPSKFGQLSVAPPAPPPMVATAKAPASQAQHVAAAAAGIGLAGAVLWAVKKGMFQ